jgi:hypothetical protein
MLGVGTLNGFEYAKGNPLSSVDPTGEDDRPMRWKLRVRPRPRLTVFGLTEKKPPTFGEKLDQKTKDLLNFLMLGIPYAVDRNLDKAMDRKDYDPNSAVDQVHAPAVALIAAVGAVPGVTQTVEAVTGEDVVSLEPLNSDQREELLVAGAQNAIIAALFHYSRSPVSSPVRSVRSQVGEYSSQSLGLEPSRAMNSVELGAGGDAIYRRGSNGLTEEAEGVIAGPHPGRKKGPRPDPEGGLTSGDHRGHLIPENHVEHPEAVNVVENLISEAPGSNLGPKKRFENLVGSIKKAQPDADVRFHSRLLRHPGVVRPYAVQHTIRVNGVVVHSVTIPNE